MRNYSTAMIFIIVNDNKSILLSEHTYRRTDRDLTVLVNTLIYWAPFFYLSCLNHILNSLTGFNHRAYLHALYAHYIICFIFYWPLSHNCCNIYFSYTIYKLINCLSWFNLNVNYHEGPILLRYCSRKPNCLPLPSYL